MAPALHSHGCEPRDCFCHLAVHRSRGTKVERSKLGAVALCHSTYTSNTVPQTHCVSFLPEVITCSVVKNARNIVLLTFQHPPQSVNMCQTLFTRLSETYLDIVITRTPCSKDFFIASSSFISHLYCTHTVSFLNVE